MDRKSGAIWQIGLELKVEHKEDGDHGEQLGFALCTFRLPPDMEEILNGDDGEERASFLASIFFSESLGKGIEGVRLEQEQEDLGLMDEGSGGSSIRTAILTGVRIAGEKRARETLLACADQLRARAGKLSLAPLAITLLGRGPIAGEFDGELSREGGEEEKLKALEQAVLLERAARRPKKAKARARGL